MKINHRKLIENLIPVLWEPGHMGAFFGRFLFDDILSSQTDSGYLQFNRTTNLEWQWWDIINSYMSFHRPFMKDELIFTPYSQIEEILKKYYTTDVELDAAIIFANVYHTCNFSTNHTSLPSYITKVNAEKYLLDIVSKEFTAHPINFPYIKAHVGVGFDRIEKLSWKKKIYCSFPKEKVWLTRVLVFYKHYWYYKKHNVLKPKYITESSKIPIENFINAVESVHVSNELYKDNILSKDFKDYIKVDMYDLIFNENTTQLINIDDVYATELSQTRKELLKIVRNDIIDICNIFGLDYKMNVSLDDSSSLQTPQIIEICNILKKEL